MRARTQFPLSFLIFSSLKFVFNPGALLLFLSLVLLSFVCFWCPFWRIFRLCFKTLISALQVFRLSHTLDQRSPLSHLLLQFCLVWAHFTCVSLYFLLVLQMFIHSSHVDSFCEQVVVVVVLAPRSFSSSRFFESLMSPVQHARSHHPYNYERHSPIEFDFTGCVCNNLDNATAVAEAEASSRVYQHSEVSWLATHPHR